MPLHVNINIGNEIIRTKSSAKYLEIRLDPSLKFADQIQYSANKARKIVGNLSRLMAYIGGPLPAKCRLLKEVGNSIMLYGSEIWAKKLNVCVGLCKDKTKQTTRSSKNSVSLG